MQNKPNAKNWDEVKMFITAIAFTITLLLWNLLSGQEPKKVAVQQESTVIPPTPSPVVNIQPTLAGNVRILFGGVAPKTQIIVAASSQGSSRSSSQSAAAPQPVTKTASSK